MVKALSKIETVAVSLVKRGAQRRRFALSKSGDNMDELIEAVLDTETDAEKRLEEVFKAGLSPKGMGAARGALRILSGFKDELPKDVMDKLADLAGYPAPQMKAGHMDDKDKDKDKMAKSDTESSGDHLQDVPAEIRGKLEELWKSQKEAVAKAEARAEKLETELRKERDTRLIRDAVAKAEKDYKHLGSASEVGMLLKSLHDSDEDMAQKVEAVFKSAEERIAKSDAFSPIGTDGVPSALDSEQEMVSAVKEFVTKSAGRVSEAEAWDHVMRTQPHLYDQYNAEKGAH